MRLRLILPLLAILGLAVMLVPLPVSASAPRERSERTFRIEAGQFAYTPSELTVHPGDKVTIQLVSTDVVHGLYLDDYDLSVEADPGQTATLTFTADKPGAFRFRCHVTCGAMHPFMIGRLTVGNNDWLFRSAGLSLIAALGVILSTRRV